MRTPNRKLVHVLIGKSVIESLLIGALAVFAFIVVFPPHFHGWGEVTDQAIAGWAVNDAQPYQRVPVQLFVNGRFVAATVADQSRPDVAATGWARDAWHGYVFTLPLLPHGWHEARIYAVHDSGSGKRKSLQLLGQPLTFTISDGKVVKAAERK